MDKQKTVILVAVAVIILGIIYWFFIRGQEKLPSPAEQGVVEEDVSGESLGGQIFKQTQNPVSGKLPTVNPGASVNPLGGAYSNPFE